LGVRWAWAKTTPTHPTPLRGWVWALCLGGIMDRKEKTHDDEGSPPPDLAALAAAPGRVGEVARLAAMLAEIADADEEDV